VETLNQAQSSRAAATKTLATLAGPPRRDVLGPGDTLTISIYEVGVALFGRGAAAGSGTFDPAAHGERFPEVRIDGEGKITLPYVGTIPAAGATVGEIEAEINRRLAGQSQRPQAMVTLSENLSNTVIVSGNVNKPGRYDLSFNGERLLDAVALAGGATASSEDTLVRFARGAQTIEQRLDSIRASSRDNLLLAPRDTVELIARPRSFTVFGAAGRVSQVSFETGGVSLAEALARVQGPNDNTADPTAVFVFRYDDTIDPASGAKPVIYRLDLLQPASYFLAQRVAMQDKDVIYIANSAANQPSKLVSIINQLFSPLLTARVLTRNN
ncbi:polysaccharide biosynthesis/export family protein, partial [Sphingomonas sp.]|uniref:polysaccharide biosynthesis/export family protein n=1 Tax=Sphingomonas sp. TaxID=28214 RepID=UPI003B3B5817